MTTKVKYQRGWRKSFLESMSGIDDLFFGMSSVGRVYTPNVIIVKYPHSFGTDQENIAKDFWTAIEKHHEEKNSQPPQIQQSTIVTTKKPETRKST